jgi:hypothetical protein
VWNIQGKLRFKSQITRMNARKRFRDKLISCFAALGLPREKEILFAEPLERLLKVVADDSVLSGETHFWKIEGDNVPQHLPSTLTASEPPRAAGASAARGGARHPPPPVPSYRDSAAAYNVYGHVHATYPMLGARRVQTSLEPEPQTTPAAVAPTTGEPPRASAARGGARPVAAGTPYSAVAAATVPAARETLMTPGPAAADPATPERREERGRQRPSPASGERPPGPKRGCHGQDTQGVVKALDYAETPAAAARALPPPGAAPAAEPIEPQSPRLSASRPRDDKATPPAAPPKKQHRRAAMAAQAASDEQAASAARRLGYPAPVRGYCVGFRITWRDDASEERARSATRHAIRHAIKTWGSRQQLGCVVTCKFLPDGLELHIYGIRGDPVTLGDLAKVVQKVNGALQFPRRSRNITVKNCRFTAKVTHRRSVPEAEVIDQIVRVDLPQDCECWCKVRPQEQAPPAQAVPAESAREGVMAPGEAPAGPQKTPSAAIAGVLAEAFASELRDIRAEVNEAISPAVVVACFDRAARLLDCAIWYMSELPKASSSATGAAGTGPLAPSAGMGGSGIGVAEEAAAQLLPPPSAAVSSGRVPLLYLISCCASRSSRHDTDPSRAQGQLRRRGLGPRRGIPGLPAGPRLSRCLPAPLGPTPAVPLSLGTTLLRLRQRQQRQQVQHDACPSHSSCRAVKVSDRSPAWAGLGPGSSPGASSSPVKRALFAAAGTLAQGVATVASALPGVATVLSRLSPSLGLGGLGMGAAHSADGGTPEATVTSAAPPEETGLAAWI